MFQKLASELVQTVSFNMQLAKLQLDGYGRRRFRAGFDSGYSIGRDHGSRGLTKSSKPGLAGHPQSEIDGIEVDHLMAPLLRALWDLGLETQFSCQGDADHYTAHEPLLNFNRSQIVFADYDQACKFVRKTMELMDSAAYSEGGIELTSQRWTRWMAPLFARQYGSLRSFSSPSQGSGWSSKEPYLWLMGSFPGAELAQEG